MQVPLRCVLFLWAFAHAAAGWGQSSPSETATFSADARRAQLALLDEEIDRHFSEQQLPALVVLYAEQGVLQYKRLRGHADLEAQTPVTESHLFRLASVSKLFAAVLGLRLQERGLLDLQAPVSQYLPAIPQHHSSRVIDLLACRGGVRHYSDPVSPQSPRFWEIHTYTNALSAAEKFWLDPLAKPIGEYHYSTHGYTLFAACVEQATGMPIAKVIRRELGEPGDLTTLAAENRATARPLRVTLYRRNPQQTGTPVNVPARPDNLSWKVCGGGLECSAWDLLRFGVQLCRGDHLSAASLQQLSARIDGNESYALGCNHSVEQGVLVFAKSGGQLGVNSYIWCAPEKQAVMVLLCNRQEQALIPQLGQRLMRIVLAPDK